MNALTILVSKYLKSNNLTRNQLAQSVGYSNINKGLRTIDLYLDTLQDKQNISSQIKDILKITDDDFNLAVSKVQYEIDAKARATFKPRLQVILSDRPSPLFVAILCPDLWHFDIPELSGCTFEQEIKIIFQVYQEHQLQINSNISDGLNYEQFIQQIKKMDKNNNKYAWTVGKGYLYFRQYGETIAFNRKGEITQYIDKSIEPSNATLSLGNKTISPSILGA